MIFGRLFRFFGRFLKISGVLSGFFVNLLIAYLLHIFFGIYSFLICLLWAEMGAVDVAFTEAAVGAGVSTVIMIATVFSTTRRSKD